MSEPHKVGPALKIEQISTTACETRYRVTDGESVEVFRLWAVVGGQLAAAFDDQSFSERFNTWPVARGKYLDKRYEGQPKGVVPPTPDNPHGVQGPTIDDITLGEATFVRYYQRVMAKRAKRKARVAELRAAAGGVEELKSIRYHDTKYNLYFRCKIDLRANTNCVTRVHYETPAETSAIGVHHVQNFGHALWADLMNHQNALVGTPHNFKNWEDLNDDEFVETIRLIKGIVAAKQAARQKPAKV